MWDKRDWQHFFELTRRPWRRMRPPRPIYPTGSNRVLPAVGFSLAELDDAGVERPEGDGMLPLPTVTVQEKDGPRLYRLPHKLNGSAHDNVALALSGTRVFPCDVEFGVLRGRPYAEFLVPPAQELN